MSTDDMSYDTRPGPDRWTTFRRNFSTDIRNGLSGSFECTKSFLSSSYLKGLFVTSIATIACSILFKSGPAFGQGLLFTAITYSCIPTLGYLAKKTLPENQESLNKTAIFAIIFISLITGKQGTRLATGTDLGFRFIVLFGCAAVAGQWAKNYYDEKSRKASEDPFNFN